MPKNYTVRDLKKMIGKAKREHKTCASFSKMKKPELVKHARELGLIDTPQEKKQDLLNALKRLKKQAVEVAETTKAIKKKKDSLLRRIDRFMSDPGITLTRLKNGFAKLSTDYTKLVSRDLKPKVRNILFGL
jgi:SMC interacting uncharacterized protein involved in chromosome segregation